ncbi:unnamed protein product [Hydatigera taeniaeformis]|uniref:Resistance to inhibitors of cholinesterase protein 3 N-terminal domain-containing protein n=1 Tax=Hydatigena taeniaeformis TaxID=6205 RepID=A0A3P7FF13_HYDTA|nr:unnamed protein product [Hydatigera taeniaeformis]
MLQINGFMTAGMSHRRAVEIIQAGGNMIRLGVRRSFPPPTGELKNPAVPSPLSPPPLSFQPFGPMPPAPSPGPVVPPPPNPHSPQFFTPLPVHKPSIASRPLLSSAPNARLAKLPVFVDGEQEHKHAQQCSTTLKKRDRNPGIVAAILPFYAFGIFVYFVYTIVKLLNNRWKFGPKKKEKHLKDYYHNFHYIPGKEKFKMDSNSSEDECVNGSLRKIETSYKYSFQFLDELGWSRNTEGSKTTPNVYRSVSDDTEITRLRIRLEQMECEMTRLLEAVSNSATFLAQTQATGNESGTTNGQSADNHSDDSETLYSAEEN